MSGRDFDWDEMVMLRRLGWTLRAISVHIGCSEPAVSYALKRMRDQGVSMPHLSRRKSPNADEMVAMRRQGYTLREIAERVGCSAANVNQVLGRMRARGVSMPYQKRWRRAWWQIEEDERGVASLRWKGLNVKDIAEHMHMSEDSVRKHLRRLKEQGARLPTSAMIREASKGGRPQRPDFVASEDRLAPEVIEQVRRLKADGFSVAQIAGRLGCLRGDVRAALKGPR